MLFYLVILLFLLVPTGFGFALGVYLKREYKKLPLPDANETLPGTEDVMDILNASSVAQDILLAKDKIPEEELNPISPEEPKLGEFLPINPPPLPENPVSEVSESEPQPQSGSDNDQDDLLASAMNLDNFSGNIEPDGLQTGKETANEPAEEFLDKNFDFDALKNVLGESNEETAEEPKEEPQEETNPRITKETFENIPVYEPVPEELLETHLCMDQEFLPDAVNSEGAASNDSFVEIPDFLLNSFEIDSSPGAEHFVQTQDAAIAIRGRKRE